MKRIEFNFATNKINSEVKEIFKFEDDEPDEVIQAAYEDWLNENKCGGWREVSDE